MVLSFACNLIKKLEGISKKLCIKIPVFELLYDVPETWLLRGTFNRRHVPWSLPSAISKPVYHYQTAFFKAHQKPAAVCRLLSEKKWDRQDVSRQETKRLSKTQWQECSQNQKDLTIPIR